MLTGALRLSNAFAKASTQPEGDPGLVQDADLLPHAPRGGRGLFNQGDILLGHPAEPHDRHLDLADALAFLGGSEGRRARRFVRSPITPWPAWRSAKTAGVAPCLTPRTRSI